MTTIQSNTVNAKTTLNFAETFGYIIRTTFHTIIAGPGKYWGELSRRDKDTLVGTIFIMTVTISIIMATTILYQRFCKSNASLLKEQTKPKAAADVGTAKSPTAVSQKELDKKLTPPTAPPVPVEEPPTPPVWSSIFQTILTGGNGNCAIHAALGKKTGQLYYCLDVVQKREGIEARINTINSQDDTLLPCELNIIAHTFNITIYYYDKTQKSSKPFDTFNPGQQKSVRVCFDGAVHYERIGRNCT